MVSSMKSKNLIWGAAAVALLASADAHAQGIVLSPTIGAYIPASDFDELRDEADELRAEKEGTLALGLNLELGWLRGSLAYASGATIKRNGIAGEEDIGEGTLLTAAADVVLRPIPRLLIVQPYLLGGVGLRNSSYDADDNGLTNPFPEDDTDLALHVGLGADVMLGGIGLVAEITDFISKNPDGDWSTHDAFAMIGLRFRLGGR